jgi:hypothetical protein
MNESQLISELLDGLTKDINGLKNRVEKLPTQSPTDYRASIEDLTKTVQELRNESKQAPPTVDLSGITARLDRIEQVSRQRPEYKMSQYVQYGAGFLVLLLLIAGALAYYASKWRAERDTFEVANWRWRYTQQANPKYAAFAEDKFPGDSIKADLTQWIVEQESADQKREAARKAAEQAKVMNAQADELEGKKQRKGKAN